MKKAAAILASAVIIAATMCISTTAFETGDIISMWDNGLNSNYATNQNSVYGGIYTSLSAQEIESINAVIKDDKTNTVSYEITFKNKLGRHYQDLYICYNTSKKINVTYEILSQEEYDQNLVAPTGTGNNIISSVGIGTSLSDRMTANTDYKGYYYEGTTIKYAFHYNNAVPAIRITPNFNGFGYAKIRINVRFYKEGELQEYITNHNDIWSEVNNTLSNSSIVTVAHYLHNIIAIDFVHKLFIVSIISIIMMLAYNWLRSL